MRKRYLFFAGFLLLLFCAGCSDDRLDSKALDGTVRPPFDVGDAKAWFDAHVEQLNLLQLSKSPVTRGVKLTDKPLLTPQWGKGNAQSNDYLQVVEIPLQTSSVSFVYRNLHRSGQAAMNENCIAQRKMVVMRRPNGYTRLFVMTLIPDREYPRKNFDFITDFRYLGKNDFSGYVMFSDPDNVEERFPTVKQIQNDPFVKTKLDAYWELTKKFADSNKGQRREYGCWIYLDTGTGRYEIEDLPPGPIISGGEGTHGSISPGGVPETVLTNPLESMNEYVALFHTHTPLTYCEGEGARIPTGPSPNDSEWAWAKNVPGIVYDYQPNGELGGIITGHPLNASAMLYTFGPNRRPTKK